MISLIEHGTYQVIKAAVYSCKNSGRCLLDHIRFCNKISRFTHKIFARLKPYFKLSSIFLFIYLECLANLLAQGYNICFNVTFLVWNFKTAPKVNELKL